MAEAEARVKRKVWLTMSLDTTTGTFLEARVFGTEEEATDHEFLKIDLDDETKGDQSPVIECIEVELTATQVAALQRATDKWNGEFKDVDGLQVRLR
jgi:hypothetical protein